MQMYKKWNTTYLSQLLQLVAALCNHGEGRCLELPVQSHQRSQLGGAQVQLAQHMSPAGQALLHVCEQCKVIDKRAAGMWVTSLT